MEPLISIIVPIYNAEKYLVRCIDSIIAQTYKNLEIILIDDGSEDSSFNICNNYKCKDNRIIVIHKQNTGVSDSRNVGIDISKGDYIGFVDSDDYIEPTMFERLYSEACMYACDVVCCGYRRESLMENIDIAIDSIKIIDSPEHILEWYFRQDIRNGIGDGNWNKLFKRDIISNTRYSNYQYCEDIEFQIKVFEKCNRIACVADVMYHYTDNDNSASNSCSSDKYESILDLMDSIKDIYLDLYPSIKKKIYAFHLTWYIAVVQMMYSNNSKSSFVLKKRIWNTFVKRSRWYMCNSYSKRLDQYYYMAYLSCLIKPAMLLKKKIG